jgi:hypothetical protein
VSEAALSPKVVLPLTVKFLDIVLFSAQTISLLKLAVPLTTKLEFKVVLSPVELFPNVALPFTTIALAKEASSATLKEEFKVAPLATVKVLFKTVAPSIVVLDVTSKVPEIDVLPAYKSPEVDNEPAVKLLVTVA